MAGKFRFLIPWILGAVFWLYISFVTLLEYQRIRVPGQDYLTELWLLLSLLWLQFGFAGIFQAVRGRRGFKILAFFLISILPPLLLYVLVFTLSSLS